MSRQGDEDEVQVDVAGARSLLKRWYHVPILGLVIAFMLWVRLQAYGNFIRGGEVFLAGNDPYYHFRQTSYTVRHWPFTMPFDPWTYFPYGVSVGHFGTLFDQIIATAALIVGLGGPSDHLIMKTMLVAPTVFGALVALPVYLIGKRLAGREGGLFAALILALLPGTFLRRSTVGFADHHVAEVFFQAFAVVAIMIALSVAEQEKPVYELLLDRDWNALRRPGIWAVLSGVGIALYLWAWPPGVVIVGILGVFFITALSADYVRGRSPEYVAFAGAMSLGVVVVLSIVRIESFGFRVPMMSVLQPLLALAVAGGCVFMAWLARLWDGQNLDRRGYPVAIGGLALAGFGVGAIALPELFTTIQRNVARAFGFGQSATTLTIAEAQPPPYGQLGAFMFDQYGLLFYTAFVAILLLGWRQYMSRYRAENVFIIVWSVFILLMALTQVRFNYYLAVVVAVLNAWLFGRAIQFLNLRSVAKDLSNLETYQVVSILIVIVIVFVPLTVPAVNTTVIQSAKQTGPGLVVTWDEELDWMADNTPTPGTYGDQDNPMDYYGTFDRTDDYAYPAGAYGVMSWWDYGHWITVEGERIPDANPFQQGPRPASAFLLTSNETRANLLLEALPAYEVRNQLPEMSNAELRALISSQTSQQAGEDTRYVMIDAAMAAGKFTAIATWTGPGPGIYFGQRQFQIQDTEATLFGYNDRYGSTMLARLYLQDGRGLSHYRMVHETNSTTSIVNVARQTPSGWTSDLNGDGRRGDFVNRRLSSQVLAAVQQNPNLAFYDVRQPATVKTYERVPGATLTGQVNTSNGTTIWATVPLRTNTGRNFTYVQTVPTDAQGNFEVTVPYATTNTIGPDEGGTDSAVVAQGNYTLFAGSPFTPSARGNTPVPESAIYDGSTITVEFEPIEATPGNETNATNSTARLVPPSVDSVGNLNKAGTIGSLGQFPETSVGEARVAADA